MPPYLFPAPATVLLSFLDLCVDPSSTNTVILADATQARSKLRNSLKDIEAKNADWLVVLDSVQGYLPYLLGVINSLEADDLLQRTEPAFPWKSLITSSSMGSPSIQNLPAFGSELVMTLTCYAAALSNLANDTLRDPYSATQGSSSNRQRMTSTAEDKRKIDKLAQAADMLCRASGLFDYIAQTLLPEWEARIADSTDVKSGAMRLGKGKAKMPGEFSRDVQRALATMALADANSLGIQKLLSPFSSTIAFQSTSLPLPRGHPSPGLLAKLYIEVATLYSSARNLLKTMKTSKGSSLEGLNIDDDIEPGLLAYLRKEWGLADVRSRKWLAVEAGEHSSGEKVGQAIAMLKDAQNRLDDLRKHGDIGASTMKKMRGLKIGRSSGGKEEKSERKGRIAQEMAEIESFLKTYTHMNNTVSFQPIPAIASVQALMPGGRPILTSKPFVLPKPAFGPGSSEYTPAIRDRPINPGAVEDPSLSHVQSDAPGTYAGAGNYF
ncbi:hypothetical protein QFC22_002291 [Naganishia vaughanmartiniae]|uniref:Uncharacterized protein n=1 Tax=Naganishia vaughanmartiniae TaxID=1424756 RepID=A0ACC2XDF4_9TREE|nr:hypothetical protein QFC22_002291 [Naganishia vaughanmartiniae]